MVKVGDVVLYWDDKAREGGATEQPNAAIVTFVVATDGKWPVVNIAGLTHFGGGFSKRNVAFLLPGIPRPDSGPYCVPKVA